MICSVLVVVDSSEGSRRVLDAGLDVARAERARLTLLLPVSPPSWCVCFAPVPSGQVLAEAQDACEKVLRRLVDGCEPDVSITTVMPVGRLDQAVMRELARTRHDLVVLQDGHGRRRYDPVARLARRCPVPLLRVPAEGPEAPRAVDLGRRAGRRVGVELPRLT